MNPPRRQPGQTPLQLWMVPAFALAAPPPVFLLALISRGVVGMRLLELFWVLGCLAPILGLVSLGALLFQYLFVPEEPHVDSRKRRRVARLAILAIMSPAWLAVMYFSIAVFNR